MRQLKIAKSIEGRKSTPLDDYLKSFQGEPTLTIDEEDELVRRAQNGDSEALEK